MASNESVVALADQVLEQFGHVNVLHLNAGVSAGANLLGADPAAWQRIIGVNYLGVVWGVAAFVPRMIESGQPGAVIATSSGAGGEGTSYQQPGYASTKAAVVTLMECLHGQLRDANSAIRAGVLFPPLTATRLAGDPATMEFVQGYLRSQRVPATLVQPESVAALLVDGIERDRFFIRAGAGEDEAYFDGKLGGEFMEWNERMISGRAAAQIGNTAPDPYLW